MNIWLDVGIDVRMFCGPLIVAFEVFYHCSRYWYWVQFYGCYREKFWKAFINSYDQ